LLFAAALPVISYDMQGADLSFAVTKALLHVNFYSIPCADGDDGGIAACLSQPASTRQRLIRIIFLSPAISAALSDC
jgi:hypothetical protein